MEREKIEQLIHLYFMGELNEEQERVLKDILSESDEMRKYFEEAEKMMNALKDTEKNFNEEKFLEESREKLFANIEFLESQESVFAKVAGWFKELFEPKMLFAFGSVATLLIGFFFGYLVFDNSGSNSDLITMNKLNEMMKSGIAVTNVKFPLTKNDNGEYEIQFRAENPFVYKGSPEDEVVRVLLSKALLSSDNPGLRLKAVKSLAEQAKRKQSDTRIKSALINSLLTDQNPGVRRGALNALQKYEYSDNIRDAYLEVLENDENSGMRVAAINALSDMKEEGNLQGNKVIEELNRRAEEDKSSFIRYRAAALINKEI